VTVFELWAIFSLGLISSLHCVQMCGPIVLSYSIALEQRSSPQRKGFALLIGHLAYNAGRIVTYSCLGAVAGLVGDSIRLVGHLAGIGTALAIVGGGLMILAGLFMFGAFPAAGIIGKLFRVTSSFLRPLARLVSSPSIGNRFLLGIALGFLPCGLIYAAVVRALATGSPAWGAVTMAAFGAGTAIALLAVGIFSSAVRGNIARWGTKLAAISVTVMGVFLIVRGTAPAILMVGGHAGHVHH
jgi:sulfite exporter TauE/SafE